MITTLGLCSIVNDVETKELKGQQQFSITDLGKNLLIKAQRQQNRDRDNNL